MPGCEKERDVLKPQNDYASEMLEKFKNTKTSNDCKPLHTNTRFVEI